MSGLHMKVLCLSDSVTELYKEHGQHHKGDSGLDLFVVEDQEIKAGDTGKIKLGIKTSAWVGDRNVSWLLYPRSSISKTPLRLANSIGLIDAGYRGEVMAVVDNIKGVDFTVKRGDKLVQAVAADLGPITFEVVSELDETARGEGGFGSTSEPPTKVAKVQNGVSA
eukprot:CAMPEP_0204265850 /NCGR_PEP_ID=MMETSP0468-20130131/9941_1 /ASSEMBLY_ACC=CAM_ASM_000383 /TAXON_ID=2969 /ORGANISM="Oxyrrhis marina" /LENGTH=165 /DNA_ID=CAMNT_0051240845 /DNA_START=68 /DNA_END=565 /DNA_ORIENTATION=+